MAKPGGRMGKILIGDETASNRQEEVRGELAARQLPHQNGTQDPGSNDASGDWPMTLRLDSNHW